MHECDLVGTIAFFRERQRIEAVTTAKVLGALSPEMFDYRLHAESSTVETIAWTIVRCLRVCNELCRSPMAGMPADDLPAQAELLVAFEHEASELNAALMQINQHTWETERTVTKGDRILLQQPLGQILCLFHVDAIHHRGQLSVFLRPFGVRVPSIYGPSGDT